MSNSLAIAAVTATLRNLLHAGITNEPDLADASITMQPLDRARTNGNNANQLNLFLYHVVPNATWRNQTMPGGSRSGETAFPPLGLNLYYLLTAFGRDNDVQRPFSHQLMGRAMSVLYDHPLLSADEIKASIPENDLWAQLERVRITLQPFAVEEIAKLWTGFQTQYRLSVAYEAAVVLIESTRQAKTPLPVIMRGPADTGFKAQGNLQSPFATLSGITPPNGQSTALLGDTLNLNGQLLSADSIRVRFNNFRLAAPHVVAANAGNTDSQIMVTIPDAPATWPAGVYGVSVVLQSKGTPDRTTEEVPLAIAPRITSALPMGEAITHGQATLALTCSPNVVPGQRVSLLLGDREFLANPFSASTNQLTFVLAAVEPGTFFLRLRVEGVDSQLIDRSQTPPVFDTKQQVTLL